MTSKELVINALNHKAVERFPRQIWSLPNVSMFKSKELYAFNKQYPSDIEGANIQYGNSPYSKGTPNALGSYIDEFGSLWQAAEAGIVGEVKKPVLENWKDLDNYKMPLEMLKNADFSLLKKQYAQSDKFIMAGTFVRPFERMQFMRGSENLFIDLAEGEEYVYRLAKLLHSFNCRNIEMLADAEVDGISFMDDWGAQVSMLISPVLWRSLFKPMYKDYIDIIHSKGKYAFFHSDGCIEKIYPDMVELGLDAINSQLFCMDIEGLAEKYGDKITFWGEIDRQQTLPFGTVADVNAAVDRVSSAIIKKNGKRTGAIAQCEWHSQNPLENIYAVFERWNEK